MEFVGRGVECLVQEQPRGASFARDLEVCPRRKPRKSFPKFVGDADRGQIGRKIILLNFVHLLARLRKGRESCSQSYKRVFWRLRRSHNSYSRLRKHFGVSTKSIRIPNMEVEGGTWDLYLEISGRPNIEAHRPLVLENLGEDGVTTYRRPLTG
jgi:hypothetical protein